MQATLALRAACALALMAGVASATPASAVIGPSSAGTPGLAFLEICSSAAPDDGTGNFAVEGDGGAFYQTGNLNVVPGTTPAALADNCDKTEVPPGLYLITPGKYLSAFCLKTANGRIVQNPTGAGDSGLEYTTARCEAKIHHWHTTHDLDNNNTIDAGEYETTIEVDEVEVNVRLGTTTRVDAHTVDVRYPECTRSATNPARICEPTGPTNVP